MQTSNWERFLLDEQLNNDPYYRSNLNGKYLFGKVMHDILECLTPYNPILTLIQQEGQDVPVETANWLAKRKSSIEAVTAELNTLWVYEKEIPATSDEWPSLIQRIEMIATEIESLTVGYEDLVMPDHEPSGDLVKVAIIYLKRLRLILADVRAEEYKRLLITMRYEVI